MLIVAAAPQPAGVDRIAALARDATLVIGVDGGAGACLRAGVTPSVVVGDLDSLADTDRDILQVGGSEFVVASPDKDVTDLDLALEYASHGGARRVVATCCTSGRLDHTLAALGSLARASHLWPRIAEHDVDGWILAAAHRRDVTLDVAGATFSVMAVLEDAVVSVEGAKWPLDRARLSTLGSLGVSNIVLSGGAVVTVHEGTVAVLMLRGAD